ncbi:hypothetical protein P3X46_029551 [Hevea brasiliensis]|uniref:Uncharacterized protein n=1 Tax=Hevea brasiliensis TaxID=3981 RepID=A0ABQ9KT23_HEVBR|nr:transcription factor AS1 [Hevea brasiliensis]KAJ9147380.1 hypothetical protein P3X46_029551 [Hevea brasiliensis]
MKERQRWQPEEDALLKAYVKQYGPKEWNLISRRMPKPLNRDPKSCLERWKNYLKPGIKRGSLTPDEQSLVISLQSKYGNRWKKIAAQLPGRTAKRLGKWWEVFKEKQSKLNPQGNIPVIGDKLGQGRYDHILDTFAEKYVQSNILKFQSSLCYPATWPGDAGLNSVSLMSDPDPVLSLGSVWMNAASSLSFSTTTTASLTPSLSVSLSLSPSDPGMDPELTRFTRGQNMGTLIQYCKVMEEGRQNWVQHKKEAIWRLSRLEQQLESEKARKMRDKMVEIEAKIRLLREEEMGFMSRIESDYREQLNTLQRDAESKEAELVKAWCSKHAKLEKLVKQIGGGIMFNN